MTTIFKTLSRALILSGTLFCGLAAVGAHTASAATASAMEQAYDESEAARDAMVGPWANRSEIGGGLILPTPAGDAGLGRNAGACHGTHLDHFAGRC